MKTSRQLVYETLLSVYKDEAYSNIALNNAIGGAKLSKQDASFASRLFYGVLERRITLEHIIKGYLAPNKKFEKLDIQIVIIISMGLYELLFMEKVPDNSAVDESVKLAAYARKASAKGFVNAVLRGFIRDEKEIKYPDKEKNEVLYYSVKYACPEWLFKMWTEQYDKETAIKLAEASLEPSRVTVRVNTLKTTADKLIGFLENRGVKAEKHEYLEDCLYLHETGSLERLPQFKQGLFHVQDASSQLCARVLNAKPGQSVIDMCSAPGSKSFTVAELMENEGEIHSFDLYEHKLKLINDGAKRLGIKIIKTALGDGTRFNREIKKADRVLCDVPCSGLGIIRRKPEIKFKNPDDFQFLPTVQLSILKNASNYVKAGGILVYSTCTTNKKENEEVINQFLSENNSFKPLQLSSILSTIDHMGNFMTTLMPHINNCDGFFIAALQKTEAENEKA